MKSVVTEIDKTIAKLEVYFGPKGLKSGSLDNMPLVIEKLKELKATVIKTMTFV